MLFEPEYIYQAMLVCFTLLGVTTIVLDRIKIRFNSLILLAIVAAPFIFKTPLAIKGLERLRMVWVLFFVCIAAIGMRSVIVNEFSSTAKPVFAALVVLLSVSGGLAAADDLEITNFTGDRTPEVEFEDGGERLQGVARFSNHYSTTISAPWASREGLGRFGAQTSQIRVSESGIYPETRLFLTRDGWSNHVVKVSSQAFAGDNPDTVYLANVYFSQRAIDHARLSENNIYSSGKYHLLYSERKSITFT